MGAKGAHGEGGVVAVTGSVFLRAYTSEHEPPKEQFHAHRDPHGLRRIHRPRCLPASRRRQPIGAFCYRRGGDFVDLASDHPPSTRWRRTAERVTSGSHAVGGEELLGAPVSGLCAY